MLEKVDYERRYVIDFLVEREATGIEHVSASGRSRLYANPPGVTKETS